jgi:hypothetical protein
MILMLIHGGTGIDRAPPKNIRKRELFGCYGKEAYTNPSLAKKVAKRRNRKGRRLNVYKCQWCRQWHMGGSYK